MIGILDNLGHFIIYLIQNLGYWGVFMGMIIESACIPLPSEIIMTFSGFVVWQGNTNMTLLGITLVGASANLFGSLIAYYAGLIGGRPLLKKYGKYVLITRSNLEIADKWFEKYGHEAVFISRMLPGIRTFISLPAGIAHMDIKKFIIYTFIGSLPWTFTLSYIGVLLGPQWNLIESYFHILDIVVIVGAIGSIAYVIYKYKSDKDA